MKVVLLHDWLTGFRGGERVLEAFCEMFPDAPIYTLIHQKGSTSPTIENRKIVTSFLNHIPGIHKHYRKFLPLFPLAASSLKITEDADVVLSSSHCVIKGVKKPKGAIHVSYVHSPMRYLYDQYENYFGPSAPLYQRLGMRLFKNYLTRWDQKSNENVDVMIANAQFVKQRIEKYYHLESKVINPFVETADFSQLTLDEKRDFYIMVTAFAPNKRVDLAIKAFNELGLPLKIIGSGQMESELRRMAGSNIEFLGNLGREEVVWHFNHARALIFPGVEDFGITPLESLASGTPVIARKIGGVLETLDDNVAQFFEEDSQESLIKAVKIFEERNFDRKNLVERANNFSKERFKHEIMGAIEKGMSK